MGLIKVELNNTFILREYNNDDPIWKLEEEKQKRKAIADVQKDLTILADELSHNKVVERG